MAEVLGLVAGVAGIAGFAGQMADGAAKLKTLYSRVKNADQELEILAQDISNSARMLKYIETQSARIPESRPPYLTECNRHCAALIDKLNLMIQKHENNQRNRRFSGRLKFVFNRDTVKDLRDALTRADQALNFAFLSFNGATFFQEFVGLRSDLKDGIQQIQAASSTANVSKTPQTTDHQVISAVPPLLNAFHIEQNASENRDSYEEIPHRQIRNRIASRRKFYDRTAQYILPFTWFGKRLVIETSQAQAGWDYILRVQRVVRPDALVFQFAKSGNVTGLQALFDAKMASPFDVDSKHGMTPLHIIKNNLSAVITTVRATTQTNQLLQFATEHDKSSVTQFLINHGADVNARDWYDELQTEFFWLSLGQKKLDEELSQQPDLWAVVAECISESTCNNPSYLPKWQDVLRQVVAEAPNYLFYIAPHEHDVIIEGLFRIVISAYDYIPPLFTRMLQTWVESLSLAGIDIEKYGHVVSCFLASQEPEPLMGVFYYDPEGFRISRRLPGYRPFIKIATGPEIEQWRAWPSWPLDEWAGEFWEWVENPELFLPGSWLEAEKSSEKYLGDRFDDN
ncbi:MAG: hypothetical protein Q9227_008056 [Pyrenula ochraceoflavens]